MRASLSLHLALYRKQKALIGRAVEGSSRAFRAYEGRYRRRTRSFQRVLSSAEVNERVAAADVVYVGDYHTLRHAQKSYLKLVEAALGSGRRVVLALEFVEGQHQAALDAYLSGRSGEATFLRKIGHAPSGGFDLWPGFRAIFQLAREKGLEAIAIDRRARGERSLAIRDQYAAERIAEVATAPDRPLVLVLVGQFHVAPGHLPAKVREELGEHRREHLVIYQNCEGIYWQLARKGRADEIDAVLVRDGELCLFNASPLVCQQSFLDYLEAEAGDEQLEGGPTARFCELARLIGRFVGVNVKERLARIEVATSSDEDLFERLAQRGGFGRRELAQLRRHVLSRESAYIPRAHTAYLARLSLNHAAEEAAHFVRHCAVGEALEAPRSNLQAFYARCLEEALGFFGSKLINPRRVCPSLEAWVSTFEHKRGVDRQIAAFVLAHKAAEPQGPAHTARLLPVGDERLFNGVSHGLGYLLGDALHQAFEAGRVDRSQLRALFHESFVNAQASYFALVMSLRGRRRAPHLHLDALVREGASEANGLL